MYEVDIDPRIKHPLHPIVIAQAVATPSSLARLCVSEQCWLRIWLGANHRREHRLLHKPGPRNDFTQGNAPRLPEH